MRDPSMSLRVVGVVLVGAVLSGCVGITKPKTGDVFPAGPVLAEVGFRSTVCAASFHATLDNNDVTGLFNPSPPANTLPQATFTNLTPGAHTLSVSAQTLQYWLLFPYCGSGSDAVTFTVLAPPLPQLNFTGPATLNLGSSASFTLDRTLPANPPAITIALAPTGLSTPPSVQMTAGQLTSPTFMVTATVAGAATLAGTAPGYTVNPKTITVAGPAITLTLAPGTLVIERGSSAMTTATITRSGGFTGAVAIPPTPPPPPTPLPTGVTMPAITIPATATTGSLTFTVGSAAPLGTITPTITAAATPTGTPSKTASLTIIVPPATGAFVEASPAPYSNGGATSTVSSLSGTFSVDIAASAGPQARSAQFRKGATPVGSAVAFALGPSSWGGAGFCVDNGMKPPRTRGVVMNGAPVGTNAQYSFTLIDLMGTPNLIRQMVADGNRLTPTAINAQPRIYFNPDCTLALVKGVNSLGPSNYSLTVINLETGNQLPGPCGWPMQFNTYTSPTATVQRMGAQTSVVVTVDAGTQTVQTCTFTVP